MFAVYNQVHFRLDFIMEANTMNPDKTAPFVQQSELGPYCLQYRLPKNISRREEQTTKVVTGGKLVKLIHTQENLA